MLAVSEAGPLIHLAQVRRLNILEAVFRTVTIVPSVKNEVVDEGIKLGHPDTVLVRDALLKGYISVARPSPRLMRRAERLAERENVSESDAQTLLFSKTLSLQLLTDERIISLLGRMYGLRVWNTWTILLEALRRRLITKVEILQVVSELGEKRHKLPTRHAKEFLDAVNRIASSRA